MLFRFPPESMTLDAVEAMKSGRPKVALDTLSWYLERFGHPGLSTVFYFCPQEDRKQLADLLSGYINRSNSGSRLIAAPAILCAHPPECYEHGCFLPTPYPDQDERFTLPGTDPCLLDAGKGLNFLGWISAEAVYPRVQRQLSEAPTVGVPWGRISTALAVFEWAAATEELSMPILSDEWWGDLFYGSQAIIKMNRPMLLDYTRAAEVARALQVGACPSFAKEDGFQDLSWYKFTRPELQRLCNFQGRQFRVECEEGFPEHPSWQV